MRLAALTVAVICGGPGATVPTLGQGFPSRELPVDGPPPAPSRGPAPQGIPLTEEGPREPSPQTAPEPEEVRPPPPPLDPIASPQFWDPRLRRPRPDLSALTRLRFLLSPDFPPFTELDRAGRPAGYHLELVRALCAALEITDRCQVQVMPWTQLRGALARGDGDAILAGLAITQEARDTLAFSEPYMRFPARFVVRRGRDFDPSTGAAGEMSEPSDGERVAVRSGTAHEAMLLELFPRLQPVPLNTDEAVQAAVAGGEVDAGFGDGVSLALWLAGREQEASREDASSTSEGQGPSGECCMFAGEPYFSDHFLSRGLAIAVRAGEAPLVEALDWALSELARTGKLEEIYLRTFPVGFY